MTLETDLRAALARRASDVPPNAVARVRTRDYRPRTRRVRPPVAVGALAGGVATAAVATVVALGTGASPAFAGWSATPTSPSGDQTAGANQACQARIASLPNAPSISGLRPVLTDTRGPFTFVIFAGSNGHETCISGPGFTSVGAAATNGGANEGIVEGSGPGVGGQATSTSAVLAGTPGGEISQTMQSSTARDGNAYSFIEGSTASGVTGVMLTLSDGRQVTASVQGGWFAAWWPGSAQATSATVSTASGTSTEQLASPSMGSALRHAVRVGPAGARARAR